MGKSNTTDTAVKPDNTTEPVSPTKADVQSKKVKVDYSDDAAVQAAYASADQKGKAAIRAELKALVTKAIMADSDIVAAKRLNSLIDSLKTSPTKSVKEIDYGLTVAKRIASLRIALQDLESGTVHGLPEGVELDIEDVVNTALELSATDVSDLHVELVESAKTFSTVKFGNSARRDIAAHISEWAASVESGTFGSVQTIANFRSAEYGTDGPSSGAVAARLFPRTGVCTLTDNVSPVESTATSPRGAQVI